MFRAFLLCLCVSCNELGSEDPPPQPSEVSSSASESEKDTPPPAPEIRPIAEVPHPRIRARHLLIAHRDATRVPDGVTRTAQEARTIAEGLLSELQSGGDFEELVRRHSDDGTRSRGGDLGVFTTGVMNPVFEEATLALKVGARSGVVETPFGFHIIERLEVVEVALAHILIQWEGLKKTRSERTKEEARLRADQALERVVSGQPFDEVAREWSDGPFGKRGGHLGWFQQGQMAPQFDAAAFDLDVGAHTGVVESAHGFHIIMRLQ